MRVFAPLLTALLVVAALGEASGQQVTLDPSPATRCLTLQPGAIGEPEYPFVGWKNGTAGRVKVELVFSTPDGRPDVKVLERDNDGSGDGKAEFVEAVKDHVRNYRVPCLSLAEGPARLLIEYVFKPDDKRPAWSAPVDGQDQERQAQLKCLQHRSGKLAPSYPKDALELSMQGRVLATMRFVAPDQAPEVTVYARPDAELFAGAIRRWTAGYRLPCHQGGPLSGTLTFVFRINGSTFGLKPLGLAQLLPLVVGVQSQRLAFDFTVMGCPFDIRLAYRQPYLANVVEQLDNAHPARRPFLKWLEGIQLDLPSRMLDISFGDTTTITVPCTKLDLNTKETSS